MTRLTTTTPTSRSALISDLQSQMDSRLRTIEQEFEHGFELINQYQFTATVFGSARLPETDVNYQQARELGAKLARNGFAVITGGGAGIMEAANRGAYEAGGTSIGFNIELPHEQQLNPYLTTSLPFQHFYARKVMLVYSATALICFPGGFGTLDEMFEVLTLVQTGKMPRIPIILIGSSFWKPLDGYIKDQLRDATHTISKGDEHLYHITDDLNYAVRLVEQSRDITAAQAFGAVLHR